MAAQKKPADTTIYQLKISLRETKPPIWRTLQVLSSTTLRQLHFIVQGSMGWYNSHLHQFLIDGIEYGEPAPEYDFDVTDEAKVKLSKVVGGEKAKFSYIYDFGDSWEHTILVEKILPRDPKILYPICIKGKRACPPEDCGGPWGYVEFLEAIQNPSHPDHDDMLEWIDGAFDPEEFDLDEVNQRLAG